MPFLLDSKGDFFLFAGRADFRKSQDRLIQNLLITAPRARAWRDSSETDEGESHI